MSSADESRFRELLAHVLEKNELSGRSPYKLYFATKYSDSGWSFGVPQYDLGVGNKRELFKEILREAKDGDKYIIDDGDPNTDRKKDKKVADLCAKANKKGGTSLTTDERKLIDQALSSPYGKAAIDASLADWIDRDLLPAAKRATDLASGADREFLKTDLGKLFLCDYQNQYFIQKGGQLERFIQGKSVELHGTTIKKDEKLGADELLKFYLNTKQSEQTPWDPLRRFSNIAEATHYKPSSLKEARGVLRAYRNFYDLNEDRLTDTQNHRAPLNAFRRAVVDPAANEILASWKPEWGNKPEPAAYDKILAAVEDKEDMKFARQPDMPKETKEPVKTAHESKPPENKELRASYPIIDPNQGEVEAGNWLRHKISDVWNRVFSGPSDAGAVERTNSAKDAVQTTSDRKESVQSGQFDAKAWEKQFREIAPNATEEEFRKAKIFDAVSTARIDHDIKDPELNAYAKARYYRQTAEDVQAGKGVPSVKIYDPEAEPTRVVRAFTREELQKQQGQEIGIQRQRSMEYGA
jgi:hypothetical protein